MMSVELQERGEISLLRGKEVINRKIQCVQQNTLKTHFKKV